MRPILFFLFLASIFGCSGAGDSPVAKVRVVTDKQRSSISDLSFLFPPSAERQQFIDSELDYYLQRHDPQDEGFDMVVRYAQEGDSNVAVYLPEGRLTVTSTLHPHQGKGMARDARGRFVIGCFQSDTLISGVRIDSAGFYAGQMNHRGEAWGHGFYRAADGTYYEGHWTHDQRDGLGMSVGKGHLSVGSWVRDQFRGEHMSYHSDRIYGIDISRYQHERGRRHYPILWNKLRISHLGRRISQEQVIDARVDYPVSFVYIKSTEGVTIENHYYEEDDAAARSHLIPVGAYHFFSTTTSPEEQARHFLNHSRFRKGDLPPMLDVEPNDKQIEVMGGPLVLFDHMRRWLSIVEQATHTRPLLYVNQRFVNTYLYLAPDLKQGYRFWIARYGEYKPDVHLDIWQLSGDGRVQGIVPECDLNVFNGYQGHWDEFLRTQTIP